MFGKRNQKNTKKDSILRFFIYFDPKDQEFVGVCVDLGIVRFGKDPNILKSDLEKSALDRFEIICKDNLSDELLNTEPPKEYMEIFKLILSAVENRQKANKYVDMSKEMHTFALPAHNLCPMV